VVICLDTSAFVKPCLLETGSQVVSDLVSGQSDPLPVWEIQEMELSNALRLKVFWDEISVTDADHQLRLFNSRKERGHYYFPEIDRAVLSSSFQTLSALTPRLGCRTLDILHVACALQLRPDLFVTFDLRQNSLAREAGLQTHLP